MAVELVPSQLAAAEPGEPPWRAAAREALARAPDPEQARARACDVLSALPERELETLSAERALRLGELLRALCGVAPFFAAYLRRHPEWLLALLHDDLSRPRTRDALCAALSALPHDDSGDALRRFKYFELARITARDCDDALVPLARAGETLLELSELASALLEAALGLARARVARRFGPPRFRDAASADQELGFVVLGLGKLGGEELNYSSDVDLVYVFEAPARPIDAPQPGPAHATLAPAEYFTHLARQFGKLVGESSAEGFLYRVDLELRPEGAQGAMVISDQALAAYYENWADTWEKAAFMKARPVAGDLEFGWRVIRALDPMIYRSAMDYGAVDAIRELKQKIAAHRARGAGFDVKLGEGGIRDIEFVAQALQLLHGGRIEQVRARSTQDALERLRDVRLLSAGEAGELLEAYRFLRKLENRLQMVAERQTHTLPAEPAQRARFARAMGYFGTDGASEFEAQLARHRAHARARFAAVLFDGRSDHVLELFARRLPQLLAIDGGRTLLEDLAEHFAREIAAAPNPERALNNLDRFVEGIGRRRFYFELLLDRPELVPRLVSLFASSSYLSAILAAHPTLIEPVFRDPNVLLLDREQLEADFDSILDECRANEPDEHEAELAALRRFQHRQLVNAGLLDLVGKISRRELETALTDVAEVCIARALGWSRSWVAARRPELAQVGARTRLLVVGMGKLASRELTYGSDLDLVFVFDPDEARPDELVEAQEYATRVSQRLISLLSTATADGACYEIDARLRPSGNQGTLVSSIAAFERYHAEGAALWEQMALLRARPVCGDTGLAARFEALRLRALSRPLPPGALAEVLHIRRRMERELAKEGPRRRDFKRGRGGLLDVENVVQFLQLRHGREHPELLAAGRTDDLIERLRALSALPEEDAQALASGWEFLQRLGARLRIVENRSISDLDEERGDLEALGKALGYVSGGREGGARRALLADYARHTEAIRAAYERVLGASG